MAINVFGAGAVQSAYVSYIALDITNNSLTLVWPDAYVDVPYTDPNTGIHYQVLAASMDVTTPTGNTNTITLPNATQVSVGTNFIITNVGASHFTLRTSDGDPLQDVDPGISYYAQLIDNSTAPGTWRVITFGAGTSQASAIALAGNGLVALIDKLNTNIPVNPVNIPPAIDATFRAQLVVWTGATGIIPLPAIISVPAGFYLSFSNQGTASITLQPSDAALISGQNNLIIEQQQSLTVISDGTNWQTLGFGQNQFAQDTALTLDVSGNSNVTLTSVQSFSVIQRYTGTLTGNITVFFPLAISNWFIYNNTIGAHTLSVQLTGPTGTSYVIPQGSKGIFYSDGTSMFLSPTALSLINGTETQPSLSFSGNTGSGIWSTDPNSEILVSINGSTVAVFVQLGGSSEIIVNSPGDIPFTLGSSDTNAGIDYNGISAIRINSDGSTNFPIGPLTLATGQFLASDGTAAAPAYSFSGSIDTGISYNGGPSPVINISFGGNALFSLTNGSTVNILAINSPDLTKNLQFACLNTSALISYNSNVAISISSTGSVTFPTAPLPIGSGGTNAQTRPAAINNLLPAAAAGDILYFDGADWQVLHRGMDGQVLTLVSGFPEWTT